MSAPLIKTKNLYLQKEFSEQTEQWVRTLYAVAEDEDLVCAVWTSPIFRQGFLITNEAVRWSVAGMDGEKVHGSLLKDVAPAADFTITPAGEFSRLEMTANGNTYTFFVKGLSQEKGTTLCDILKYGYTQGEVPQTDLSALIKPMPLPAVRNFFDGDLNLFSSWADKILGITKPQKENPQTSAAEAHATDSTQAEEKSAQAEQPKSSAASGTAEQQPQSEPTAAEKPQAAPQDSQQKEASRGFSARSVLLSVLDVCASLIFIAAVVIAIKPELVPSLRAAEKNLQIEQAWILIAFYVGLKIVVALFSKGVGKKIISTLLVICTIFTFFLVTEKFLLFSILCLLLYFIFEYSCGLQTKTIIAKLIVIALLGYIGYVTAHILLVQGNKEIFYQIITLIKHIHSTMNADIPWW